MTTKTEKVLIEVEVPVDYESAFRVVFHPSGIIKFCSFPARLFPPAPAAGDAVSVPRELLETVCAPRVAQGDIGLNWQIARDKAIDELRALLAAAPGEQKCETCNDQGMIGGPSFYAPDEGGVPCPDCTPSAQQGGE